MDPKASAKSKRNHSSHGRRNHPTPSAVARKKQPTAGDEPPRRPQAPALPSNWDRYDSGDEEEATANLAGADVGITPKSKGADFGYLIEQARAQPPQIRGPGPESGLFEGFVPGFTQGASSILSVRGENLLSWCEDDNFIVDDDPTSSYEVPFLSMDLNALAAQLSKLKLSRRLFIEADLLPEEANDQPQKSTVTEEQPETSKLGESSYSRVPIGDRDSEENEHRQGNACTSTVRVDNGIISDSKPQSGSGSKGTVALPESKWNKTRLETTATSEAEIEILLESFDQSGLSSNTRFTSQSSTSGFPVPTKAQDLDISRNTATSHLDDEIDGLLGETSLCVEDQGHIAHQQKEVISSPKNASSSSRHVNAVAALDDSIDLLLAETSSFLGDKKQVVLPIAPTSCPVASKPIDDFDSWFDTL